MRWHSRCALLAVLVSAIGLRAPVARAADESAPGPIPAAASVSIPSSVAAAELTLEVVLVNDPDLPKVDRQKAEAILSAARRTVAEKFGYDGLRFEIRGEATVAEFLSRNLPVGDACLTQLEPSRVRPGTKPAASLPLAPVAEFLARWRLEELRAFFPEAKRAELNDYGLLANELLTEMDKKHAQIASFKLASGRSLLAPELVDQRSYVRWICGMRNQNEADLILTNAFMLYDLGSEPYPHSIFQKCKVGGASLLSPARRAIGRRAVVASTFSMDTSLPFFREDGVETLNDAQRLEVIGTFIVAHELGHAVFKLPDFYDHPAECLMTTKYETGYVSGFRELVSHPGVCRSCQPYVEAKRHVFSALAARAAGRRKEAIASLKEAIRATPRRVDGSYVRYVADLTVDIAELYLDMGDRKESRRWLKSALRVVPDHEAALALDKRIEPSP